jgi:hypothetical protein
MVANRLLEIHRADSSIPLDPELYVAAQGSRRRWSDPWHDLAGEAPARRFRQSVRKIVTQLKKELRGELRYAMDLASHGRSLEAIMRSPSASISPLGRYILAHRAGRGDLKEELLAAASEQHRACPLYRQACAELLSGPDYPVPDVIPGWDAGTRDIRETPQFSLN